MKLGLCSSVSNAATIRSAGFDFVEENVQGLLHAHDQTADQWRGADLALSSPLPVPSANSMVPGHLKITGPSADPIALAKYMTVALSRARRVGIGTIVFGSGGARAVPDGFSHTTATDQIVTFLKSVAPLAEDNGVTLVVEHLNRKECNILNGIAECADVVRRVNHPAVRLLFDSYHFWMDGLDLRELADNIDLVRHVHLADHAGRVPPGVSGKNDYRPVFALLKKAGYGGRLAVESAPFDIVAQGPEITRFVRQAYADA
jgi:sugar phosphate isomerase/epimerase